MTYRYVVYDLQKNFNAAFDDADFTFNQILYWVQVVSNRIRVQHNNLTNSDLYTSTFSSISVQTDEKGRKYIDLPVQIMELTDNAGIIYITYNVETCKCSGPTFAQTWFQSTSVGGVQHLYLDEYTKPSIKNPYYYRIGDRIDGVKVNRIYLIGVECIDIEDVEIAVKANLDPTMVCNIDDEIPIPSELIQDLTMQVLELGRFVMLMPNESLNDGEDSGQLDTRLYSNRAANLPDASVQQQTEQ